MFNCFPCRASMVGKSDRNVDLGHGEEVDIDQV